MQRLHESDLTGYLLEREDWMVLRIPAIAVAHERYQVGPNRFYERKLGEVLHPARESAETLRAIKERMGTHAFSAQYQQSPVPPEGAMIKWRWFRRYLELPARIRFDKIIQSWDTATKTGEMNDYSVRNLSTTLRHRRFLFTDSFLLLWKWRVG